MPRSRRPAEPPPWDTPDGWYPPSKPLPVEGGLRAKSRRGQIGDTWWSRRFLAQLEQLGLGGRFDRGKRYARQGQVLSLEVEPGAVTAAVQGSRARPYAVRLAVRELGEAAWRRVEAALVERAVFLAQLLAGEMPPDIEDVFDACGLSLFPAAARELTTSCSCPDWANPCKHIAAVAYLLGEAFDDDPFLMLAWRGRDRETLLDNLRALRGGPTTADDAHREEDDPWQALESLPPVDLAAAERFWDRAGAASPAAGEDTDRARRTRADAVLLERDGLARTVGDQALVDRLRPAYAAFAGVRAQLFGGDERPADHG